MNRENLCKLDGLRTVAKPKQKFYMKGLLTIACNMFLQQGRLFPTSAASFSVTKSTLLSQTTNVRLFSNCVRAIRPWIEIKSEHVTAVLLKQELHEFTSGGRQKGRKIHRKLVTSIFKTFHHFNRSSADNKHRTRSHDLWGVTGNRSHA